MYQQIKRLADEAIALQNKCAMDETLRMISGLCDVATAQQNLKAAIAQDAPAGLRRLTDAENNAALDEALIEETLITYPTSTMPGGDTPEMKKALTASMEVVKKPAKKAAK